MQQIIVKAAADLAARPADIYATIADYRHGHPQIIPPANLYDLTVESGGYGVGTVIRFKSRLLGVERSFHQQVSEPEPGKIIVEQDIDPGQSGKTTFTVIPIAQGEKAHVEIACTMTISPGIQGMIERMLISLALPPVFRQELKLLEQVAPTRSVTPRTAPDRVAPRDW